MLRVWCGGGSHPQLEGEMSDSGRIPNDDRAKREASALARKDEASSPGVEQSAGSASNPQDGPDSEEAGAARPRGKTVDPDTAL